MSDDSQRPIVIKRIKKAAHGHHGGAWKIAFADFVTAMMAFFLLMWLLGSTSKATQQGISDYFKTPLKVALMGGQNAGETNSIIKGGGDDMTKLDGEVKKGETPPEIVKANQPDLHAAEEERLRRERVMLEDLKHRIEQAIEANPQLAAYKNQILLDITSEGLRIQVVDEKNRPMFDSGASRMKPYTQAILREIGKVLNEVPNRLSLSGHTDAQAYAGGERGYSNWELSSERANAARRELVTGGLADNKVLRVVGQGSSVMLDRSNPENPSNRRISIIVLNKQTEESLLGDQPYVETGSGNALRPQIVEESGGEIAAVSDTTGNQTPTALPASPPAIIAVRSPLPVPDATPKAAPIPQAPKAAAAPARPTGFQPIVSPIALPSSRLLAP